MNLSAGIVGLPNVGKSTLFNALLKKQQAFAANYPFATIEPNVGIVPVPDGRLQKLAEIVAPEVAGPADAKALAGRPASDVSPALRLPPIKPATVKFIDIAGLVKGAAEGAGLGNKFLSHIREVSVITHVVRAFVDENVIREGSSDPRPPSPEGEADGGQAQNDYAVIQTELLLADLQSAQNHESRSKNQGEKALFKRIIEDLNAGILVREMKFSDDEKQIVGQMFFLTAKPEIVVLNVSEDEYTVVNIPRIKEKFARLLTPERSNVGQVVICAKIESELSVLSEEEQKQYLKDLGLAESGLEQLIRIAYKTLGLISFLTAGEKEVRAWTIRRGETALRARAAIHTDFEKNFIIAEAI